ncbi:MAG: hypothetical protein IPO83_01810 [Chitinophagaceae bacterium]|nr:hypothetical protein [Chitinophagaceae bacterium]
MNSQLRYVPAFRCRQQEIIVIKSFDFGDRIYPLLEIIQENLLREESVNKSKKKSNRAKRTRTFEDEYLPILKKIKAKKIFIDLPVQLNPTGKKNKIIQFLQEIVGDMEKRIEYIKKLSPLSTYIIPVISTYSQRSGTLNSITTQEARLRNFFPIIAFRTFRITVQNDLAQIKPIIKPSDYIILDLEDASTADIDGELKENISQIKELNCTKIIQRNAIPKNITYTGLEHGAPILNIDNELLNRFHDLGGDCFSDYAGIKKRFWSRWRDKPWLSLLRRCKQFILWV